MAPQEKHPIPTLPLHLTMMSGWLSSVYALPRAKSVWPSWSPLLLSGANPFGMPNPERLLKSLQNEAANRANDVLQGILRYQQSPYTPPEINRPVLWQKGNVRLLDYSSGKSKGAAVLFIPSLINRYYILDLEKKRSMLAYLSGLGHRPMVLDWGAPGNTEQDFDCEDYISKILLPAIRFAYKQTGRSVQLAGYCMGGVFALAAAQLLPKEVGSLALLATPWDFHCRAFTSFLLDDTYQRKVEAMLAKQEAVPASVIQALFYMTDPFVFEHKFRRFYSLQPDSEEAKEFIALEHWVNDGIPMTVPLAKDCLIGWAQQNILQKEKWQVGGETITPTSIRQPAFVAIPKNDHVVPFECAMPLAAQLRHARIICPDAGHVSMIVGCNARNDLWHPFSEWLTTAQKMAA